MSDTRTPAGRPAGRALRGALIASLAVNLLIVGAVAGMVWRHAGPNGPAGRGGPPGLGSYAMPYVHALPEAERRALHALMREGETGRRQSRAARQAAYVDVLTSLRAEPFDPAVLSAALARQRDTVMSVQDRAQAFWLERIEAMDATERTAFADRIEKILSKPARRNRGKPRP